MVRPSTNVLGLRDGGVEPPSRLSPFAPTHTPLLSFAVVFLLRKGRNRVGSTPERSERGRAHCCKAAHCLQESGIKTSRSPGI
jgi:hypothetical protein